MNNLVKSLNLALKKEFPIEKASKWLPKEEIECIQHQILNSRPSSFLIKIVKNIPFI